MKKLLIVAVIAVAGLASCKKDYTCTCTTTTTPGGTGTPQVTTFNGVSKGAARANCLDSKSTYTFSGVTVTSTTDCELN